MNISSFEDLLRVARQQPQPQRMLFVFARAELPEDSTSEQRARFQAGQGGALVPLMSADKVPGELSGFAMLAEESRRFGRDWAVVFVSTISGNNGRAPTNAETDRALERMVNGIKMGVLDDLVPFDRFGNILLLD